MKKIIVITSGSENSRVDNLRNISSKTNPMIGIKVYKEIVAKYGNEIEKIYFLHTPKTLTARSKINTEYIEIDSIDDIVESLYEIKNQHKKIDMFINTYMFNEFITSTVTRKERMAGILHKKMKDGEIQSKKDIVNVIDSIYNERRSVSGQYDNIIIILRKTEDILLKIRKIIGEDSFFIHMRGLNSYHEEDFTDACEKELLQNTVDILYIYKINELNKGIISLQCHEDIKCEDFFNNTTNNILKEIFIKYEKLLKIKYDNLYLDRY